ncbi:MAG: Prepilin peptidase [Frankiales bacterium]|nr:Prepilin peptidase [Frankiales bacterium]
MILLVAFCALIGLMIGSFLNVVVWRVPRGESVVSPPSACPRCGVGIRSRDNVPVLGWLVLKGRCRDCGDPISARYPLVEAGTAVLFAVMALRFGLDPVLPAYLYLAAIGIALALIDLDVKRLPDALTLPSYVVVAVLLAFAAVAGHHPGALLRALVGAVVLGAFYFVVWFAYPAGMGFGDVKLAPTLGAYLGWLGYGVLATGAFLGFLYGGLIGIGLVLFKEGGRKTKIPFGPFMLLGTLTAILFGQELVDAYLSVTLG